MKILAFAATNSRKSINKAIIQTTASLLKESAFAKADVEIIDLNDYEMPIYSIDRDNENGVPPEAREFYSKIGEADAVIISFAEHNGFYTAAYKNLFDWTSRISKQVYQNKPVILFAAAPGPGGARNVLKTAENSAQFYGMDIKATLSIPRFHERYDLKKNLIIDDQLETQLRNAIKQLN